jgi:hypothetical protein
MVQQRGFGGDRGTVPVHAAIQDQRRNVGESFVGDRDSNFANQWNLAACDDKPSVRRAGARQGIDDIGDC